MNNHKSLHPVSFLEDPTQIITCQSFPIGKDGRQPILKTFTKSFELLFHKEYQIIQLCLFGSGFQLKEAG